jgi:hypothetical protein
VLTRSAENISRFIHFLPIFRAALERFKTFHYCKKSGMKQQNQHRHSGPGRNDVPYKGANGIAKIVYDAMPFVN